MGREGKGGKGREREGKGGAGGELEGRGAVICMGREVRRGGCRGGEL